MSQLIIDNLHKSFGEIQALDGVSFEVSKGEIIAILGPSGCGKSTLLSIIAGLEATDNGRVMWAGRDLAGVAAHERGFGLMFQDYALFPHKNVYQNIAFGLQMAGLTDVEIDAHVIKAMQLVGLPDFSERDINLLSGGEQQRVALARTLAPQPKLLMLDEPLGSLDRNLRDSLLRDMQSILEDEERITLYVTHDQEEAFSIADRIVLLKDGKIAQVGNPQELYASPKSVFVAQFLGLTNLLTGKVKINGSEHTAVTNIGELSIPETAKSEVTILLRPDAFELINNATHHIEGSLASKEFHGMTTRIEIEINAQILRFDILSSQPLPQIGENVRLGYDPFKAIQIVG
ncbi:MAG: ABC transporter ATP-binding protein [Chloroflexota bacterium]